jgi:hypothetical protein
LLNEGWQWSNLSVPFFQGFATQSRRRQAGYSLGAADQMLDQTERSVIRQTENAFRAIVAGIREVQARRQALMSAESALEATNAGFDVGTQHHRRCAAVRAALFPGRGRLLPRLVTSSFSTSCVSVRRPALWPRMICSGSISCCDSFFQFRS